MTPVAGELDRSLPRAGSRAPLWWLPFALFCFGHFFIDLYSASLGALQPLLIDRFHLSYTQAGVLGGLLVFSSSVMQPVYGYLSDRFHTPLFSTLAPAFAGVFLSALGYAPGFAGLLAMAWMGGAGVASFHPQAAANATHGFTAKRGRAMAVFICSGTVGLAAGPAFFSFLSGHWGLEGAAWGAIPGVAVSLLLLATLRELPETAHARVRFDWTPIRAVWKPMLILYLLVFIRSIVQIVFTQFLPLYLHKQRGYTLAAASLSLSMYLLGGALGGLLGGNLADRFGGKRVILASMIGSAPFLISFLFTAGWISAACLFVGGLFLLFTIPVNVLMAQELAPTQAGTVSALMMGFAWGMAGLVFIPLTGWVSDHYSMQLAFTGLVLFPLLGFLVGLKLPERA